MYKDLGIHTWIHSEEESPIGEHTADMNTRELVT